MSNCWVPLLTTQHSMPKSNQHIIIDLVPPHKKIFKLIKTGSWKLSLGGGDKREPYLMDGFTGLNLSYPIKMYVPHFVRCMPRSMLLTKVLNHYRELNFCRQCIYQQQSRICGTCHLNKLPIVSILWNCFSESPW